jgi:hypothetical protein
MTLLIGEGKEEKTGWFHSLRTTMMYGNLATLT